MIGKWYGFTYKYISNKYTVTEIQQQVHRNTDANGCNCEINMAVEGAIQISD